MTNGNHYIIQSMALWTGFVLATSNAVAGPVLAVADADATSPDSVSLTISGDFLPVGDNLFSHAPHDPKDPIILVTVTGCGGAWLVTNDSPVISVPAQHRDCALGMVWRYLHGETSCTTSMGTNWHVRADTRTLDIHARQLDALTACTKGGHTSLDEEPSAILVEAAKR